jgi:hypothetical protein
VHFGRENIVFSEGLISLLTRFPAKHRVAVDDVGQHHRQDDDYSPKGEAQGLELSCSVPESDARREDVRIKGGNKAKISCEKQQNTASERKNLMAGFEAFDESIESNQAQSREGPDEIDSGFTEPVDPNRGVMKGRPKGDQDLKS